MNPSSAKCKVRRLGALLVLALGACSPPIQQGVPPDALTEAPQTEEPRQRQIITSFVPPEPTPLQAPEIIASVHQPYAQRQCNQCHISEAGQEALTPNRGLCLRCHGERTAREGWDHGPLNFGLCLVCHVPHASQYPHLEAIPQPDLCIGCHSAPDLMTSVPDHLGQTGGRCTECHDPHRTVTWAEEAR